jgi:hypothetical protein
MQSLCFEMAKPASVGALQAVSLRLDSRKPARRDRRGLCGAEHLIEQYEETGALG